MTDLHTLKAQLEKWKEAAQAERIQCPKCKAPLERSLAGMYCRQCQKLR